MKESQQKDYKLKVNSNFQTKFTLNPNCNPAEG